MTTPAEAVYPRGKVAGPYPALSSRPDEAYVDFIADARNFLLHAQQYPIAEYSRKLLGEAGVGTSPDPANTRRAIDVLMQDPAVKTYYRVKRSLQESFWNRVLESYGANRKQILEAFDAADHMGPGSVSYDAGKPLPDYARVEIHLQPGGYCFEPLAGMLYDYGLKVFMGGAADHDFVAKMGARAAAAPADGQVRRILDLGCSAGATTTALKAMHPQAEVHGIDLSAPMVRYAHLRAIQQKSDVHFHQMNAAELDFPDGHFDMVLAMLLFHETPVPVARQVLQEAYRVLRPGGTLSVLDFSGDRKRDVYVMLFAELDGSDNGEPFIPPFVRSNIEDVIQEVGFELKSYDPSKALTAGRIAVKP
ncbi:MAG: class I SAM-dependent methyltransferase [Steroidobacteraceae bacterium]|jgi:SAM-dependent methyltransferase|nr:class I SAM-dependent methyltransferase [Steroidobacteraceae bacterium]